MKTSDPKDSVHAEQFEQETTPVENTLASSEIEKNETIDDNHAPEQDLDKTIKDNHAPEKLLDISIDNRSTISVCKFEAKSIRGTDVKPHIRTHYFIIFHIFFPYFLSLI